MMDNNLEISTEPVNKSNETPWGVPWSDLIESLRLSKEDERRLQAIKDTVLGALEDNKIAPDRLEIGGAYGSGTLSRDELNLQLYAVYEGEKFHADNYIDKHLEELTKTIKNMNPQPQRIEKHGFAVTFVIDDIAISLYAAGELYGGPSQLAYSSNYTQRDLNYERRYVNETDSKTVHVDTTCNLIRCKVFANQSLLFKDMVRVVRKWVNEQKDLNVTNKPNDLLIHLLVFASVRSCPLLFRPVRPSKYNNFNNLNTNKTYQPYHNNTDDEKRDVKRKSMKILNSNNNDSQQYTCIDPKISIDTYKDILRKFFHICSATDIQYGDTIYSDATPSSMSPLFLWWPILYDRPVIDHCIATGQLSRGGNGTNKLLIVDIAVPFVNVSNTLFDWTEFRTLTGQSAVQFERKNTIQTLQDKLQGLTQGFQHSIQSLTLQIQNLQVIENSPRRWTGTVQFTESHMSSDQWKQVLDIQLRAINWRVNVRKTKTDGIGYSNLIDITLQMTDGKDTITRPLDVDVMFRSNTMSLTFDKDNDHVFMQKRADVVRNRDYPLQITVIG